MMLTAPFGVGLFNSSFDDLKPHHLMRWSGHLTEPQYTDYHLAIWRVHRAIWHCG